MAKYTITIQTLKNNKFDFGLQNYPIFDENYRKVLNNNILNHYYMNEIGFETAELFKFYLNQKLNEIMPYYNILYENQLKLHDNLINNVNLTEELKGKNEQNTNSNSSSNSTGNANSKNVYLDTPQGNEYKGTIDDTDFATNVTFNKNDTSNKITDETTSKGNSTNEYIKTITGNNGGKYNIDLLQDLKNGIMNVDMMIISELEDLFMGLL